METNLLTKEDIKEIERIVREIAADNILPGSTDVEAEFTTRDCDPLVSRITSYGSANSATGDAYGADAAEVTYLPLAKLDDNAADAQAGNRQFGVPNERDDAADDAGEQEGDIKRAPIIDLNVAQEAGKLVQRDEEVSVRITCPYTKSTETPLSCCRLRIKTPSGFKIIASETQMDGRATIIPLGKLYESYNTLPPGKQSGACALCYEEHNAMLEITDDGVPDLNTSGMVKTGVGTLLPIPFADVQVWTRGLEPTNGGTVFPSAIHNRPR